MEMFILAIYLLGLLAGLVLDCSIHRYRTIRDANENLVLSEMARRRESRNNDLVGGIFLAFIWPATIVGWVIYKSIHKLYSLASRPGEIKARRDILNKE